jgi:serine phosphatase RsbU (regulator of sigma subunit)/tetratricopeptide (TPR) repeat protein
MKLFFSFFTLFFLLPLACPAQNKLLDSLKGVLRNFEKRNGFAQDKSYINTSHNIAVAWLSINYDSCFYYSTRVLALSEKINYPKGTVQALIQQGRVYHQKGLYKQAMQHFEKSLPIAEKLQDKQLLATVFNAIGITHNVQGNYPASLESFLKSLAYAEEIQDIRLISNNYNSLGNTYRDIKNFKEALSYYEKSLEIRKKTNDKRGMSVAYSNIGLNYKQQGMYDKAIEYYEKSLELKKQVNDKVGVSIVYNNMGSLYDETGHFSKAIECQLKSIEIREPLGDKEGMSSCFANIARTHKKETAYPQALEYAQKSYLMAQEIGSKPRKMEATMLLSEIYELQKDFENAHRFYKLFTEYQDSLYNENAERKLNQLTISQKDLENEKIQKTLSIERLQKEAAIRQAEIQEKEAEATYLETLAMQEKDKRKADSLQNKADKMRLETNALKAEDAKLKAENKMKEALLKESEETATFRRIINFLMLLGLLSVLVFAFFIYRSRQKEKHAKELVSIQKTEIEQINEELHITLEQVKEYSEVIEEKNKHITASIQYAQRIQQAILPLPEEIQKHLPESFILFKPRDIVSGDFYYFHEQEGKLLLAVIDCTGHGVPGAFMTMIGYEILNEIILNKQILSPEAILYELHRSIRKALKQAETNNKDGMDLSLVLIDKNTKQLEFAGAKNPMLYIQHNEIVELKADKMPIGGEQREAERFFTKQTLDISLPTTLFMFTDGYQDQFGGEKKQKFRIAQMKQLFLEHHTKTPKAQCEIYGKTIDEWMHTGNEKQIDDILLMGVYIV